MVARSRRHSQPRLIQKADPRREDPENAHSGGGERRTSLTAATIISSVLVAGGDVQLLFLAAYCCVIVALYQIVNFYLGYKLQRGIDQSRTTTSDKIETPEGFWEIECSRYYCIR